MADTHDVALTIMIISTTQELPISVLPADIQYWPRVLEDVRADKRCKIAGLNSHLICLLLTCYSTQNLL